MKKKISRTYAKLRLSFVKSSPFYGTSLDRRSSLFDIKKFIDDPWPGNPHRGKNILNGILNINDEYSFDINIISENKNVNAAASMYIDKFSWIRDMQAIGGSNTRKYVREAVSQFIDNYRKTKKFWCLPSWDIFITSERIVNWMLEYSFFAVGATDKFQKKVLSSITEQFSHICRLYKAEEDPLAKLSAMRAILFCLNFMRNNNKSRIKKLISDISEVVFKSFDSSGMYITRNPSSHFMMFKILLEIRFVSRNFGIEIPKEIFNNMLVKMATCVRFFRMGDGEISRNQGEMLPFHSNINDNDQSMIDTALSFVDIEKQQSNYNDSIASFDRLHSKNIVIIINKKYESARSQFIQPNHESGLNIFDFEASFQKNRLINRADISVLLSNGHTCVKPDKHATPIFEKQGSMNAYELTSFSKDMQFAIRREISMYNTRLSVSDFSYISKNATVVTRIFFNKNVVLSKANNSSVSIECGQNKYIFVTDNSEGEKKIVVKSGNNNAFYPSICVLYKSFEKSEYQNNWFIEETSVA